MSDEDLILFSKPRALAYYTQKTASGTLWELDEDTFGKQAQQLGATYFLYYSEIEYTALNAFVDKEKEQLKPVFTNEKFILYKLNDWQFKNELPKGISSPPIFTS